MIARDHGQLGHAQESVGRNLRCERAHFDLGEMQELGVLYFVRQIGLEPVGRIMALRVSLEFGIGPGGKGGAQFLLCLLDAALAVERRMTTGEDDLGFPIKRAQKLAFPAVPHAGPDRADVAHCQDE